jgi:Protein of unknown function, DUF481
MKKAAPFPTLALLPACVFLLLPSTARAQGTPTFEFAKAEAVKTVEWKAQVKGGFVLTEGNSQTKGGTFAASVSRKEGNNKLTLDGGAAYGVSNVRSSVLSTDPTMPMTITDLTRTSIVSTNNWVAKGRYDRFFTLNNSGYASGQAAADKVVGKTFYGGGQIGYSRQLLNNQVHLAVAEIGYDFSYERYVDQPGKTLDPVSIHSARIFVGETLKVSSETGITASVEALFNLNKEGKAAVAGTTGQLGVAAFKDTRAIGKIGLTTTLRKRLSIGFGVTTKYDQNPAPLPVPAGSPAGSMYASTFYPFADKLDTLAEATLIYTFL